MGTFSPTSVSPATGAERGEARGSGGGFVTHLLLFIWLGLIHINAGVVAIACAGLPNAGAACALIGLVTLAVVPRRASTPPGWGKALAKAVTEAARRYFPCALEFEDEDGYLNAAKSGRGCLIGLEPHGVLPLSIISFAWYFIYDEEGMKRRGFNVATRQSRALASSAIFKVPFVRHLWTWLGLDPISRGGMIRMLRDGKTCVIIPGGVAECMAMEKDAETLYLKKRFGFVKVAIQTGADLVPAYTFGQTRTYGYWRLGPPLVPKSVANWIGKMFAFAPIVFWGKWFTPIPYAVPLVTVVGKPIPVTQNPNPSREEVASKLDEFIEAMTSLYERNKKAHGYEDAKLVVC